MRCCFFSPGYKSLEVLSGDTRSTGGAEAQIAYLAATLVHLGHDTSLIYGEGQGRAEQQKVADVTCINAAPLWRRPSSVMRFWQVLDSLSPDLLYARLPSDFLWMMGLFAKYRQHTKFLYAIADDRHCNPWQVYRDVPNTWFHGAAYALGLRSADVIAIQHGGQLSLVSEHLQKRLVHVPNLVRSFHEAPRVYEKTIYDGIWIATMRPEKQVEEFLALAQANPDLRFAIVGGFFSDLSVEYNRALEGRIRSLGNIEYLGPRRAPEVLDLLSQSKVLVNTSLAEGFPNTMLEAWSVGVPVVSLSVDPGGVIHREKIGLVSGTSVDLQRDVRLLACTEELNRKLGDCGLNYVRRQHSLDAVLKAFACVLSGSEFTSPASDMP
ncbi:glycosyltransferase [Microvirga splendida]|uniref:Glycosyltransferase family 4 protein n=1 Tax=Microvirga splendida TaxID=2795727 RepID=A0ABS0Y8B3_9HYPH|nr:glycosyltransferase family 4 protein [Microvirga splendida]